MRVRKVGLMADTPCDQNSAPIVVFETVELYVVRPVVNGRRPLKAVWRQREAAEASSRTHRFWPGVRNLVF